MKIHSTNYTDTFIEIADDSSATQGEIPPLKNGQATIASRQFEMVSQNPYRFIKISCFSTPKYKELLHTKQ